MLKIINLVKSEFIKNYSIKRFLIISFIFLVCSLLVMKFMDANPTFSPDYSDIDEIINGMQFSIENCNNHDDELLKLSCKSDLEKENEYLKKIKEMGVESRWDWRVESVRYDLQSVFLENFYIDFIKDKNNDEIINEILDGNLSSDYYNIDDKILDLHNNYTSKELDELYSNNNMIIDKYMGLYEENKYYLYLEYQVENNKIEKDKIIELLIDRKVDSNFSYFGLGYMQYRNLWQHIEEPIASEEEYKEIGIVGYDSYEDYVAVEKYLYTKSVEFRRIILYSIEHEIKHDIIYNSEYFNGADRYTYMSTKLSVNRIFHFSVIITLIIAISNSGIVSKEHSNGTIKNIITAPVKRWKILLSKFIYLILDMYILWLIALIILSIVSGFKFGFSDLFTPKLVFNGEKVIEINYYLYLLKNIFVASIPVICFLSILLFLSTISLNTSLTVGVMSGLSIGSFLIWFIGLYDWFKEIIYMPFWYFDCGFIINNANFYNLSLGVGLYNIYTGIFVSLVVIIILYLVSNIIYIKRDIKT